MTMDAPMDAPAEAEAPAEESAPEMMDPESEATAAAAAVAVFGMLAECTEFTVKQMGNEGVSLSCKMGDGSAVDYMISAAAVEAAIAEAASEG